MKSWLKWGLIVFSSILLYLVLFFSSQCYYAYLRGGTFCTYSELHLDFGDYFNYYFSFLKYPLYSFLIFAAIGYLAGSINLKKYDLPKRGAFIGLIFIVVPCIIYLFYYSMINECGGGCRESLFIFLPYVYTIILVPLIIFCGYWIGRISKNREDPEKFFYKTLKIVGTILVCIFLFGWFLPTSVDEVKHGVSHSHLTLDLMTNKLTSYNSVPEMIEYCDSLEGNLMGWYESEKNAPIKKPCFSIILYGRDTNYESTNAPMPTEEEAEYMCSIISSLPVEDCVDNYKSRWRLKN